MATSIATRRLAAILAADVVGYSRLMGADEEGTHERFKAHLRDLVEPKIREHHGRTIKTIGDGMLVEFASVVDAARCAFEVQRGMIDREPDMPDERRIRLRIGINLGDVIAEGGDIFGDGVNVAARLEALAEPGGICISRTVRDQIRDKLPYPLEDMGEQSVKNIARPVRVYALRPEAVTDLPASSTPPVTSTLQPAVAPRLSIVVLPFANLSDDREQQYFADGLTDDLTTDLSRIAYMFVISRSTAFTYKDKLIDAKQIGRELAVRYVLEGSVRRSGNHVRVNVQLIDAEIDAHLWAERFDRDRGDLFALQDEITRRIAVTLAGELTNAEAARATDHPDVLDYILQARAIMWKQRSRDNYTEVVSLLERALALDPRSIAARSELAQALANRVVDTRIGMTDSATADIERANGLIAQVLAVSPSNQPAHYAKAQLLRAERRCQEAIPEYETAIALNRNAFAAYRNLGACKLLTGSIEESISLEEQAIRLSPRDPVLGVACWRIGSAHLLLSRIDEAIMWFEKARSDEAGLPYVRAYLASAYALKGETARAAAELAEARRLSGGRYSSISRLKASEYFGVPKVRALFEATYFTGLRLAGIPEE
jgi:TolB-like protein/Tfp pilus assembly protein PilF